MSRYPHLLTRNGHYYFRIATPLALYPFVARKDLVFSLKTKNYAEAKVRSWAMLEIVQDLFNEARTGKTLTQIGIKSRINTLSFLNHTLPIPELPPETPLPTTANDADDAISKVFQAYLAECTSDRGKTLDKKKSILNLWLEIIGEASVRTINKEQARQFKTMLMRLPANMKQRYGDRAIKDIDLDKVPQHKRLAIGSINDKLSKMAAFVNWMIRNGYYEAANPFIGISLKDDERSEDKRHSFSDEQLKAIFQSSIYITSQTNTIIKDSMYWLPLIALYSGARLQEICQLYITDIKQIGEIWVFDFNSNGADKRIKTTSSKRKTPIHPKLKELGLLDYRCIQKKQEKQRLFSDLPISSDGTYSSIYSKRFNYFLKRLNVKTDKTSFHSFRHTFIDAMRNTNVHREVREALVGHLDRKSAHDTYGSAIGIQRLYEGILELNYDRIFVSG